MPLPGRDWFVSTGPRGTLNGTGAGGVAPGVADGEAVGHTGLGGSTNHDGSGPRPQSTPGIGTSNVTNHPSAGHAGGGTSQTSKSRKAVE